MSSKLYFLIKKVATDALVSMEKAMKRDNIEVNDRQLACARINSKEGQDYLNGNFLGFILVEGFCSPPPPQNCALILSEYTLFLT